METTFGRAFTPAEAAFPLAADAVPSETAWRDAAAIRHGAKERPKVIATRWQSNETAVSQASALTADDQYVVKIVLKTMDFRFAASGKVVHDGRASAGMLHVTEPGTLVRSEFRGAYDALHLFISRSLIAEHFEALGMAGSQELPLASDFMRDPVTERLARGLLTADQLDDGLAPLYVGYLSGAIVTRLLSLHAGRAARSERNAPQLAKWRLKRALDFIEQRFAEPISLEDIASETGLTRMYFAAQFRAATGFAPHEYLLRRRVERAQELLLQPDISVVDVALTVGFHSQSHFTTIFARYVGQPPHAWRVSRLMNPRGVLSEGADNESLTGSGRPRRFD